MLTELQWPARLMVIFLVGLLPVLTVVQARLMSNHGESEWPSRQKFYVSTIVSLWMLALASLIAAAESGFRADLLGLTNLTVISFVIWLLFSLSATAALIIAFKAFGQRETPLLRHLIPQTRAEKITFIGVSITAGICEELVFRGFLVTALRVATGSTLIAALISAAAFGISHAHQDIAGGVRAGLLGLLLTVPLIITGSLYPAIVAHAIVDIAGGLWLARWLLKS